MIELEFVLAVLREMNAEVLEMIEQPGEQRDAFAFGKVHGMLLATKTFQQRLEAKIEEDQANERERD